MGIATLGNLYRSVSDADAQATLDAAAEYGITYVDTAPHYGQGLSERRLGQWLKDAPRPVISTKVGRVLTPIPARPKGTERHGFIDGDPFEPEFDYSYDGVMRSFESSLARLGIEGVDILLAHDLGRATHGDDHARHLKAFLDGGYKAMAELKAQGRVRAIGLGVNEWQIIAEVMGHADIDTCLLAGRYTLLEQEPLDTFLPLCEARDVSVIIGGPFNSGVISGGPHYNYEPAHQSILDRVAALRAVCDAHGVSILAAALQFPLAHPAVVSVIPGMASPDQVRTNVALMNTPIPDALWRDLRTEGRIHPEAPTPQGAPA